MESPPASSGHGNEAFDHSHPFSGVVVCCTSIPTDLRATIGQKTQELGGIHKYDLTPDVTHLIVGEYDTPKYRHVAKERPDIKAMAVGWVDAVRNLWVKDEQINFRALEEEWCLKAFETGGGAMDDNQEVGPRTSLICCLTGFDDQDERQRIIDKIKLHGGRYTGDLSKLVTHLIARQPAGKKYLAARNWGLHVVHISWVHECIERGMILDEKAFDPLLPEEERGVGAWNRQASANRRISLGKRQREAAAKQEQGRRKLRKTASMKLNSQRDNMWGEILGQPSVEQSASHQTDEATQPLPSGSGLRSNASMSRVSESADMSRSHSSVGNTENRGDMTFASCCLYAFGFPPRQTDVLVNAVSSLGGFVVGSVADITKPEGMIRRFVIVPQSADQKSIPLLPDGVDLITECFIERCLHRKALLDPRDHVIGRPFPVFPIEGFEKLSICTAGFTDVDLLQVDKTIRQLGARFQERFNAEVSLLLCASLGAVRKQKLDMALHWKVPIIKAEWLWACISQGKRLSTKPFLFPELKEKATSMEKVPISKSLNRSKSTSDMSRKLTPKLLPQRTEKRGRASLPGPDMSAFDPTPLVSTEPPLSRAKTPSRQDSNATTVFETAPTNQPMDQPGPEWPEARPGSRNEHRPLGEKSASELNRPSAKDAPQSPTRKPLARVRSEVCDSEAGDDDDEGLDAPNDDDTTPKPDAQPEPNPDADSAAAAAAAEEAKEAEEQKARREKAEKEEAERLALSSRLTSLLGGGAAAATENTTNDNTNSNSDPAAATAVGKDDARPASRRKRRDVIGRAISNVSVASTGSADSSAAGGTALSKSAATIGEGSSQEGESGTVAPAPAPSTQVEYDDPHAKISRERLVSKMLRGGRGQEEEGGRGRGGDGVAAAAASAGDNKVKPAPAAVGRAFGGRSMRPR
ncbi:subunit of DNA polymerase II [Diaporthe helianthi]|uniref:Subunit of DNA polymerase II n=1 Tax=Diaporthe helianthi TaxID=158607 RepID=A0A2P5I1A6_DIAHE|nr:subunit of DNA polymerase II [Diaporthe helianthi]